MRKNGKISCVYRLHDSRWLRLELSRDAAGAYQLSWDPFLADPALVFEAMLEPSFGRARMARLLRALASEGLFGKTLARSFKRPRKGG